MAICGIYKIVSPVGKTYIGQSIDIEGRWKSYKNTNCANQKLIFNSLKKYSVQSHLFEVIYQCEEAELSFYERHFISLYNSCDRKFGLNIMTGGRGVFNAKITSCGKGKNKATKRGRSNPFYGKTHTEEVRKRLAISTATIKSKPVLQYRLDGVFIAEWPSAKHAAIWLGHPNYRMSIGRCCLNKQRSAYGYLWKFKDKATVKLDLSPRYGKGKRPIVQLSKEGEIVRVWECGKYAAQALGIDAGFLNKALRGKKPTAGGYKWEYKTE